ncbi:MAG: YidH family protein [Sulfurihydrogenibium azorense]
MAAERTFLAWIRTSISLITFGFVLEKFDYFLKEISIVIHGKMSSSPHIKGMGIGFIIVFLSHIVQTKLSQSIFYLPVYLSFYPT